jgi:hypothetical protein
MTIKPDWRGQKASGSNKAIGEPWEEHAKPLTKRSKKPFAVPKMTVTK